MINLSAYLGSAGRSINCDFVLLSLEEDWIVTENSSYKFFYDMIVSWQNASDYCNEIGSHLIAFENKEEIELVEGIFMAYKGNNFEINF